MRADHVNRHVVHRKVTMLAERTNTLASEFTHSGTGHLRWKATATFWSGSDSGIMRKRESSRYQAAKTTRRNPGGPGTDHTRDRKTTNRPVPRGWRGDERVTDAWCSGRGARSESRWAARAAGACHRREQPNLRPSSNWRWRCQPHKSGQLRTGRAVCRQYSRQGIL